MTRIRNKKVLVTGGGGFIGSYLAKKLFEKGNFVRVVDVKWDDFFDEKYYSQRITLDLRDKKNCLKALSGIDYVFNLATNVGGVGYLDTVGADVMYDNVLINTHIIRGCLDQKVKRIFFSSSACIYPKYRQEDPEVVSLKEEDAVPADPENYYGWEKLYTEKMMEAFAKDYGLDIRIARFHNVYGPGSTFRGGREKSPAAICRKVAEAKDGGTIEIWGDGKQTRSYCFVEDCVEGIVRLMELNYEKPLNIGSDRLVTIDELADIIIKISGKKLAKKYNLNAPQGVRGRNSDNTLLRRILGWEPKTSLEVGLAKTYEWICRELAKGA